VMSEVVKHAHAVILDIVGRGKNSTMIDHTLLHSEWLKEAQFVADLESALHALFPGSDISVVSDSPAPPRISFTYTPL
jgi:hypothetical protein